MPRRSKQSIVDDTFELLKGTPIWVGPILAVVVFAILRFVFPALIPVKQGGIDAGALWRPLFSMLSWVAASAVVVLWIMAEFWKLRNRHLLDSQTGLASIRSISWRDFERLVGEAYRRKGYMAEVVGTDAGDGGVDVRLHGHGQTVLIQCKQWKAYKVGVTTVRELLGVVVSENASQGIVVTSGRFTQEARTFARRNSQIILVDGPALAELIRGIQIGPSSLPSNKLVSVAATAVPTCPLCGTQMVLRTARKGQQAGSQFWGCPSFPACRGTRQLEAIQW
jgi:restriction system protein